MKYVLMVAFISCSCIVSQAQQDTDKTELAAVWQPLRIGDPLYLILNSETTKEVTKAEFEKMDMNLVEYVKVLKDVDSVDIYGERGKNGVVLIVMKSHTRRTRNPLI